MAWNGCRSMTFLSHSSLIEIECSTDKLACEDFSNTLFVSRPSNAMQMNEMLVHGEEKLRIQAVTML